MPISKPDEVAEARATKIPVIQRAEILAELMRLKYGIAVDATWISSVVRYRDPQEALRVRLRELAGSRVRYGYRRLQ